MKTRVVVHIALNAKNERVGSLVEAAGRLIPFDGFRPRIWSKQSSSEWIDMHFNTFESVPFWKAQCKKLHKVVRFQRVTLIGESK